jgi:hypothetical protein
MTIENGNGDNLDKINIDLGGIKEKKKANDHLELSVNQNEIAKKTSNILDLGHVADGMKDLLDGKLPENDIDDLLERQGRVMFYKKELDKKSFNFKIKNESKRIEFEETLAKIGPDFITALMKHYDVLNDMFCDTVNWMNENGGHSMIKLERDSYLVNIEAIRRLREMLEQMLNGYDNVGKIDLSKYSEDYKNSNPIFLNPNEKTIIMAKGGFSEDYADFLIESVMLNEFLEYLEVIPEYDFVNFQLAGAIEDMAEAKLVDQGVYERLLYFIKTTLHHQRNSIAGQQMMVLDPENIDFVFDDEKSKLIAVQRGFESCFRIMKLVDAHRKILK